MPTAQSPDKYSNLFQVTAQESAANTLTFGSIELGLTIFQKVALLLNRIVVDWNGALFIDMDQDGDKMILGLTQSNSLTTIALSEPAVIFKQEKVLHNHGTAANAILSENVVQTYDLSTLPGGGELIVPKPLYWAIQGVGLTAVVAITMRVYFQVIELKPDEYFELLESRRFFGAS